MPEAGVLFDERTGQRILAAVRYVEGLIRGGGPGRGRYPVIGGGGGLIPLRTPATAIAARTGTGPYTVASGTGTHYTTSGSTLTVGSATDTIWNPYPTALPTSKLAWCTWWDGKLWVVTVEC